MDKNEYINELQTLYAMAKRSENMDAAIALLDMFRKADTDMKNESKIEAFSHQLGHGYIAKGKKMEPKTMREEIIELIDQRVTKLESREK